MGVLIEKPPRRTVQFPETDIKRLYDYLGKLSSTLNHALNVTSGDGTSSTTTMATTDINNVIGLESYITELAAKIASTVFNELIQDTFDDLIDTWAEDEDKQISWRKIDGFESKVKSIVNGMI